MQCCRCPTPASTWMVFFYSEAVVELHEIPHRPHGGYALCDRHADSLSAPVGWELVDTRAASLTAIPMAVAELIEEVA